MLVYYVVQFFLMNSKLVCLSRMPEICELPDRKLVAGAAALVRRLVVEHTHRYPVTVCLFPEQNIQPLHHSNGHPLKKEQPEQSHGSVSQMCEFEDPDPYHC
jgi:hypothetical protein